MKGFQVVTSDDCNFGEVVDVQGDHLIVQHGTLRKSKYAIPETFAHADSAEETVRLSVSKEIVSNSPKLENGSVDRQAVAEHYGLAEGSADPDTQGFGETIPDDPARTADQEAIRTGVEPADQQRAEMREGGFRPEEEDLGSSPGLLGDRIQR